MKYLGYCENCYQDIMDGDQSDCCGDLVLVNSLEDDCLDGDSEYEAKELDYHEGEKEDRDIHSHVLRES